MKKLLAIVSLLALPFAASAQSTNITQILIVDEGVRVNSYTNQLPALAVVGIHAAYESYKSADTNNTATFRGFTRQYVASLSEGPLKELGKARQLTDAKIDKIMASILANWETASAADRKLLTDWLAKYPVAP